MLSLDQVRNDIRVLQSERDNLMLFNALLRIESTLMKVDDRIENLEISVNILREDVSKANNNLRDINMTPATFHSLSDLRNSAWKEPLSLACNSTTV
jgi:hypothetical protein